MKAVYEKDQKQKRRGPAERRDMSNCFKLFPALKLDHDKVNKEIKGYQDMGCIITNGLVEHGGVKLEDYIDELSQLKLKGNDSLKKWNVKANLVLEEDIECLNIAKRYGMSNNEVRVIESSVEICCSRRYNKG